MGKKKLTILFTAILFLAVFAQFYKLGETPACINADEAAFGYNAYSILKTAKDEYGTFLPLRLKSFGDYKLPLYAYLSIPSVAVLGLNELSVRLLAKLLSLLFPILIFFLAEEIFANKKVSLLTAFLTAVSPWIQMMGRQAHEVVLASFLITLALLFLIKFTKTKKISYLAIASVFNGLALFSYHIARVWAFFLFLYLAAVIVKKRGIFAKKKTFVSVLIFLVPILFFLYSEFQLPPSRVENLLFYKNVGFTLKINELRGEHNIRAIHNKATQAVIELTQNYLKNFSPDFLIVEGDVDYKFGYPGISYVTVVEYILLFIGVYFSFAKHQKHRLLLLSLFIFSPLAGALSWQEHSLKRVFYLFVPVSLIVSYGLVCLLDNLKEKRAKFGLTAFIAVTFLYFLFFSWDFYFFHYQKKAVVSRAWQCGYKQLSSYVQNNYNRFDKFYITKRHGQPYIFLLFYLKYSPRIYQQQAKLTPPDEYGFGQVEEFDKFVFSFAFDPDRKNVSYIGYPEHFINTEGIDFEKIKKIKFGEEEMFWIHEN